METKGSIRNTWKKCKDSSFCNSFHFEQIFYRIGLSIGNKPWLWLIASLCISGACGPGLFFWKEGVDDVELYIPENSVVRSDAMWVKENFKNDLKYESIIITAPNVLEPEVLYAIDEIENSIENIIVNNQTWHDVCAGYLTWFQNDNSIDKEDFPNEGLVALKSIMPEKSCIYQSILKLWKVNGVDISSLTKERILDDITTALKARDKGNLLTDIAPLLSRIESDKNTGKVIGAKAILLNWMLKKSNQHSPDWELEFIKRALFSNYSLPEGVKIYAITSRSFKDVLFQVLHNNFAILFCGLALIIVYVMIMIGKCNQVQQRIYLSLMGVSVVGQAILSSYGVCFYMGYSYGPIHPVLPFLLLGIGVDDMFVIIQSLESLTQTKKKLKVPERIAQTLQQSGMSIAITSLTNIVAFAIGITTVMPFLESFCAFATMGIFFLFIFEIMFFISCLVLDERRLELAKDGCCCQSKPNWKPNTCSQRNLQHDVFIKIIGPIAMKPKIKIFIILLTIFLFGINIWGVYNLESNYDPLMYLNKESYPLQFSEKLIEYFPRYGKLANIYLAGVDYYEDREALSQLFQELSQNPYINNKTLNPWFIAYDKWLINTTKDIDRDEYFGSLSEFLLTRKGQSYVKDIKFNRLPIVDYNITTSKIQIQHVHMNTTTDQVKAMRMIREIMKSINFTQGIEHFAIFSQDYISWTANQIIGGELIRNLCLEIFAIGLVSILVLRDLKVSIWVICCVLLTLVDLLGSMHYLGLTIEISTSIIILLCAGLSVDYAAHVGLEFTLLKGTKNERSITTLGIIGPAVFNGGFSTFLAFVLLATSKAYLFSTFFKLFTLVVMYGLFHGLLFLPVVLSIFGPNNKNELEVKIDSMSWDPKDSNKLSTIPL
ncbi:NPC intracellular cholesterol transporter 1-like [Chelonus insularis]|uniref:NPC intracellular cholesterol transporter 1-like n=1 Tax=Chelonus insularis TaxID=460826 RepID=UPI00158C4C57|nr:NPC intracellular cholesterol transporter 1-like [Chelonus insularis]